MHGGTKKEFSGKIEFEDGPHIDAFGRFRISQPYTIFDSKQIFDNGPLFWDDAQTSGSGTSSSHSVEMASSTMSVSALTAGTRVRQTKRRFNYESGKSHQITMSGVLGAGVSGVTKRIGYFDENNGLYFELNGTALKVVRRTKTSGSVVNNEIAQSSWNIDKLDGTGNSGITLDITKTQIFIIDFEWLGVGRVRFGFVINGIILYFHEILSSNNLTVVYMSTPNLPVRYEISNDGSGLSSDLVHICCSVMSEGGQEERGLVLSTSNGDNVVEANVTGTIYATIGLKLKSNKFSATIIPLFFSMIGITVNDFFEWGLYLNPTVAGTFTYSDITNSSLQAAYGVTANTVSGGTLLNSGYSVSEAGLTNLLYNSLTLGSTIAGVSDILVLTVMPIGSSSNLDIYSSITWKELI